jgi:hypothetical protein
LKKELIDGIHYYLEKGKVIFTQQFHLDRGFCCGNKCRHCPFYPKYIKGTTKINEKESEE